MAAVACFALHTKYYVFMLRTLLLCCLFSGGYLLTAAQFGTPSWSSRSFSPAQLLQHAELYNQLLDLNMTSAEKQQHARYLQQKLDGHEAQVTDMLQGDLAFKQRMDAMSPAQRQQLIERTRPMTIDLLLKPEAAHDEATQWMLRLYLQKHPSLVASVIPFTRHIADALIDSDYFIGTILKGQPAKPLRPDQRQAAYQQLGKAWKGLPEAQQRQLLFNTSYTSAVIHYWPQLGAASRLDVKLKMVGADYLTAAEKRMLQEQASLQQQAMALGAQQGQLLQNEINFMKQSQDIIMGRGIRWNPAANRYEQMGGVVTEFWAP